MRRFALVSALLGAVGLCAFAGPAAAQSGVSHEDVDACQPDIHRLCESFYPDEKRVATCLVERRSDLSQACAEVLARPAPDEPKLTNRAE